MKGAINMRKIYFVVIVAVLMIFSMSLCVSAEIQNATLTVSENNIIKKSSKNMLGINDEWKTSQLYFDSSQSTELSEDYWNLIKTRNIPINQSRMSGAGSANFRWKETLGTLNERINPSPLGLVEWIKCNKEINPNMDLTFTLNITLDTIEDHADLVRFLTLNPDDTNAVDESGFNWAQYRVELGIKEPVNIKTFELGNEVYYHYVPSCSSGEGADDNEVLSGVKSYVEDCINIVNAMKEINPNISFSASDFSYSNATSQNAHIWNEYLINNLSSYVDYIVHHRYYYDYNFYWIQMQLKERLFEYIDKIDKSIRPNVYMSEYGYWQTGRNSELLRKGTSLHGVLTDAKFLNGIINCPYVTMANIHTTYEEISSENYWFSGWDLFRIYDDGTIYATGPTEMLKIFNEAMGDGNVVKSTLSGNDYCVGYDSFPLRENTPVGTLTVSAHKKTDGGLNLLFVNSDSNVTQRVKYSYPWLTRNKYKLSEKLVLTSANLGDNNIQGSSDILYTKRYLVNDDAVFNSCDIEPNSIVLLKLVPTSSENINDDMKVSYDYKMDTKDGLPAFNNRFGIVCEAYENSELSNMKTMELIIPKLGISAQSVINDFGSYYNDLCYWGQSEIIRNTAYFDINMPDDAQEGKYEAIINNSKIIEFYYIPKAFENSSKITVVGGDVISNDAYKVSISYDIDENFINENLHIEVSGLSGIVHSSIIETVNGAYEFKMPTDAVSGKYTITIKTGLNGNDDYIASKEFTFMKPDESVLMTSLPMNSKGEAITQANIRDAESLHFNVRSQLKQPTNSKYIIAFYSGEYFENCVVSDTVTLEANQEKAIEIVMSDFDEAKSIDYICMYVWNDLNELIPLMNKYRIK